MRLGEFAYTTSWLVVQQAAEAVVAGETPGVSTIEGARNAALEGAKRIMRHADHFMRPAIVHMLQEDIRPLMEAEAVPSINDVFQFWLNQAAAGMSDIFQD